MNPDQDINSMEKTESWNMANQFMEKIDNQVDSLRQLMNDPLVDGIPQWNAMVRRAKVLYILISVYLDDAEKKEAHIDYLQYFVDYPVEELEGSTILPSITEEKLFDFLEWSIGKMKQKGALVPPQFDPDMVL